MMVGPIHELMVKFFLGAILLCFTVAGLYPHFTGIKKAASKPVQNPVPFKQMLGVNAFEWNFLQNPSSPDDVSKVFEPKMKLIESFGAVRHYLDWERIEPEKGKYSFNPSKKGGWNYDALYKRCKQDGIDVLVCLKTCPDWLLETYPKDQRDAENVPMPFGSDKGKASSYILQARAAFQFAARYGYNKSVDGSLIKVDMHPRWTNDQVNQPLVGLGLVKYIECDNERDKWWKGDKANQTAGEYAANLSAFYDGDQGRLGAGVGVKAADPNMKVVMAGLAKPDPKYVYEMVEWCRVHRGLKKDGTIDLCFDIINYHFYANDNLQNAKGTATTGVAPEVSNAAAVADQFVKAGEKYKKEVWVTEAGYDINPKSTQRAVAQNDKPALITQADWLLRTAFLYVRHGVKRLFFYELYDDNPESQTQYASSGLIFNNLTRKPSDAYILQANDLIGSYNYKTTISENPLIDIYDSGHKAIYVLMLSTQQGRQEEYLLKIGNFTKARLCKFNPGADDMIKSDLKVLKGEVHVPISETPVFVQPYN